MKKNIVRLCLFLSLVGSQCFLTARCAEDGADNLCSVLAIKDICVKNVKARCADLTSVSAVSACIGNAQVNELCAETACVQALMAQETQAGHVCTFSADIAELCSDMIQANTLIATFVAAESLCVQNLEQCTPYKVYLSLSDTLSYTLGDSIDFDTIVDDPNNDVLLAPTRYVVPKTGYYMVTFGIGVQTFDGPKPITGTPVIRLEVVSNGKSVLKAFETFLTFGTATELQNNLISGIVQLQANDEITARMLLAFIDPNVGATTYAGTAELSALSANGQPFTETFLILHYLSSDCNGGNCPQVSKPCQGCTVECPPCSFQCTQCFLTEDCQAPCQC